MRIKFVFICSALALHVTLHAQEIELENLETPNSPGFILLDVAPTAIERPTSTKAFSASVLNALNNGGSFPKNYAAECAPFWFFKSKRISALRYWGINDKPDKNYRSMPFSALKLGSVSIAFVNKDTTDANNSTNFSIGGRTTVFKILGADLKKNLQDANNTIIVRLADLSAQYVGDPAGLAEAAAADAEILKQEERLRELVQQRPVFAIDVAAAWNWIFENQSFSDNSLNRNGVWATLNYSQRLSPNEDNKDYFNVYGVCRYMKNKPVLNEAEAVAHEYFDYGGRIEFQFENLSVSYELLGRKEFDTDYDTFRSSGYARYRIKEGLYITSALGKNFGDTRNLISQIGISYGGGVQEVTR